MKPARVDRTTRRAASSNNRRLPRGPEKERERESTFGVCAFGKSAHDSNCGLANWIARRTQDQWHSRDGTWTARAEARSRAARQLARKARQASSVNLCGISRRKQTTPTMCEPRKESVVVACGAASLLICLFPVNRLSADKRLTPDKRPSGSRRDMRVASRRRRAALSVSPGRNETTRGETRDEDGH